MYVEHIIENEIIMELVAYFNIKFYFYYTDYRFI